LRRSVGIVVLTGIAVAVVAGCGGGGTSTPASAPSVSAFNDPQSATGAPPDAVRAAAAPTVSHSPETNVSLGWKLVGTSRDGKRLFLTYVEGDGDCTHFTGFSLQEDEHEVTISALGRESSTTGACADPLILGHGYVNLHASISDRILVHSPVTPGWSNVD